MGLAAEGAAPQAGEGTRAGRGRELRGLLPWDGVGLVRRQHFGLRRGRGPVDGGEAEARCPHHARDGPPRGIREVQGANGTKVNETIEKRVFPKKVGQVAKDMLSLVVTSGTGEAPQVGDEVIWGKTGTTENYGDAWFVGSNEQLTVAVWV